MDLLGLSSNFHQVTYQLDNPMACLQECSVSKADGWTGYRHSSVMQQEVLFYVYQSHTTQDDLSFSRVHPVPIKISQFYFMVHVKIKRIFSV